MSGGEGHRLVVEEEPGEVMRLPLLPPPAAELERACDPEVARVEADDLPPGMEDAAVSRPGAAQRDGHDVAHRRDSVAGRPGRRHYFGGSERAYLTPRLTHGSGWRLARTPSASTRSHPFISRPRISNGPACGFAARASVSSGSTRRRRPPWPLAATDMLPPTRKARPPNIFFSETSGAPAINSRMRLARSSSYATHRIITHPVSRRIGHRGSALRTAPTR